MNSILVSYNAAAHREPNKIEAIKATRVLSGLGLKEAKDFIVNVIDNRVRARLDVTNRDNNVVVAATQQLSDAGFDVVPTTETNEYQEYRIQTRKMIAVALEDNNISFARALLDLYERHLRG